MKKILFLMLAILLICGCEVPADTASQSKEVKVAVEQEPVGVEDPKPTLPEKIVVEPQDEKMESASAEIKVEAIVLAKEESSVSRTIDEIIAENRWGYSIYDPKTGVAEYYASKGGYLGKRSIQ